MSCCVDITQPGVFQAPKENDVSVQELINQIRDLMEVLDEAVEDMGDMAVTDVYGHSAACLVELQGLYE